MKTEKMMIKKLYLLDIFFDFSNETILMDSFSLTVIWESIKFGKGQHRSHLIHDAIFLTYRSHIYSNLINEITQYSFNLSTFSINFPNAHGRKKFPFFLNT